MKSAKNVFPVGALIAGIFILFNPNVTIIDLVPDCIAYALFLYALRHVSVFVPYMREAADGFRRLFYLSLVKLPALIVMLTLAQQRVTITLFSFTFAILELVFLFPAISNLFEGLFYMGQRFGCEAAIRDTRYRNGVSAIRTTTFVFFVAKMALSTLPDFLLLFEYDPISGSGFTIPMAQYGLVVAAAFVLSLIFGIIWLSVIIPYLRTIRDDAGTAALSPPEGQDFKRSENRRLQFSLPFFLFALGACLSLDFVASNISLLPDYLSAASFFALALLFYLKKQSDSRPPLVLSGAYLLLTVLFAIFRSNFFALYTESDLSAKPEAAVAYIPVLILSLLSESAFIAVFIPLCRSLYRFYRENAILDTPQNEYEVKLLSEERRTLEKQNRLLSVLAILSAVTSFLTVLLAYFKEPSAVADWQRFFLPLFTSFWLIPFVLALVLGISTALIARGRTQELYRMWDVEPTSSIE